MLEYLAFLSLIFHAVNCDVTYHGKYVPPRSIEYPFGDEMYNDYDFKEWRHLEKASDYVLAAKREGNSKCKEKTIVEEREFVEQPYEQNECSKCDVRPLLDKKAVVIECYQCSGFKDRVKRRGRYANRVIYQNLTYLVQHLSIFDYKFTANQTVHV